MTRGERRPVLGRDRDPGVVEGTGVKKSNPLVPLYGPGPEGATCGGCAHLYIKPGTSKRYYKCDLRRLTESESSDHRVRWQACGRYEKESLDA